MKKDMKNIQHEVIEILYETSNKKSNQNVEKETKDKTLEHEEKEKQLKNDVTQKPKGKIVEKEIVTPLKAEEKTKKHKKSIEQNKPKLEKGDKLVLEDEIIYSSRLKEAPTAEKSPSKSSTINQVHNAKTQVSLKAAIKERTDPIQISAKQLEDDSRGRQENSNQMSEEIKKASDEKDRIREEKELEQMHKEETAAEIRMIGVLANGAIAITTIDALSKEAKGIEKTNETKKKKGFFGKIKEFFNKGEEKEEEIIEDGLFEKEGSLKDLNIPLNSECNEKVITTVEREKFSANMEKILTKNEKIHSFAISAPKKKRSKNKIVDSKALR